MEQDNHDNQYANGICCQLKKFPEPEYEVVPFTCKTRKGFPSNNITLGSSISCAPDETLVSCGIEGKIELIGTYIWPNDPETCHTTTSRAFSPATAIANCCTFPKNSIYSVNTIENENQINNQIVTKCPIGSTLTGCQGDWKSGYTIANTIRGIYPGPQQDPNTIPPQFETTGIDTQNQCIVETKLSEINLRGGAQCLTTEFGYKLNCVTTAQLANNDEFDGNCPTDYQLIACNTYTTSDLDGLESWYILSGGTSCWVQQDGDSIGMQYANGICCQLIKFT